MVRQDGGFLRGASLDVDKAGRTLPAKVLLLYLHMHFASNGVLSLILGGGVRGKHSSGGEKGGRVSYFSESRLHLFSLRKRTEIGDLLRGDEKYFWPGRFLHQRLSKVSNCLSIERGKKKRGTKTP